MVKTDTVYTLRSGSLAKYFDQKIEMSEAETKRIRALETEILEEIEDLDPGEITRAQSRNIDGDMERIRKLKNDLRNKIRMLISPLDEDDPDRKYGKR